MTEIPIGVQQRRHYRIYPSDLQAYARSLAGADS